MKHIIKNISKYIFVVLFIATTFYSKNLVYADTSSVSISKVNSGDVMYVSGKNYFIKSGTNVWVNQTFVTTKTVRYSYSRFMYNQNGGTFDTRGYHNFTQTDSTQFGIIFPLSSVQVTGVASSHSGSTWYTNFYWSTSLDGSKYDNDFTVETCYAFTDYTYSSGNDSVGSGVYYDSSLGYHIITDNTAPTVPTITPSTTSYTAGNVSFTIGGSQDIVNPSGRSSISSGVSHYEYQIDSTSGAWIIGASGTVSLQGVHTIYSRAIDNVGNISSISSKTVYIDKSGPSSPAIHPSTTSWINGTVTFTIDSSTDGLSGVSYYQYQLDSTTGTWTNGTSGSCSTDGNHIIYARAVDKVGNIGTTSNITIHIDKTAPIPTISPNGKSWTNDISVTITSSDSLSGVKNVYYAWSNSNTVTPTTWTAVSGSSANATLSTEGQSYLWYYSDDNVGNASAKVCSNVYQLDISVSTPTINPNGKAWTNANIPVTITSSDSLSGIKNIYYAWSNSNTVIPTIWTTVNGSSAIITLSTEGQSYLWYYTDDNVGNASAKVCSNVYQIDETNPISDISVPDFIPNTQTTVPVTFNNITDNLSGVASITASMYSDFRDSNAVTQFNPGLNSVINVPKEKFYDKQTIYAKVIDNAGNISFYTMNNAYLDPYLPDKPIIISPSNDVLIIKNEPVLISWKYSDPDGIPQKSAVIIFTNQSSLDNYKYYVDGAKTSLTLAPSIPQGNYIISIITSNTYDKTNISSTFTIRKEIYKTSGTVYTTSFSTKGSPISYIQVLTNSTLQTKLDSEGNKISAVIKGWIVFPDKNGYFDDNLAYTGNKLPFTITDDNYIIPIKLPYPISKVKILYSLSTIDGDITPVLENLRVFAR